MARKSKKKAADGTVFVMNKMARPYNLKGCSGKDGTRRVTVRLIPGINRVVASHWEAVAKTDYVKRLVKGNRIGFDEDTQEEGEFSEEVVDAQSKDNPLPKTAPKED